MVNTFQLPPCCPHTGDRWGVAQHIGLDGIAELMPGLYSSRMILYRDTSFHRLLCTTVLLRRRIGWKLTWFLDNGSKKKDRV